MSVFGGVLDKGVAMDGEPTDWSFIGAVIIISVATFVVIITITYYCWLYEIFKTKNKKTALPHTTRRVPRQVSSTSSTSNNSKPKNTIPRPSRPTRQRAVNIAIHKLKTQSSYHSNLPVSYHQQPAVPVKPVKSEQVRSYMGNKTSSSVESSSTTMSQIGQIETDSDTGDREEYHVVQGLVVETHDEPGDLKHIEPPTPQGSQSHRSRKWSQIKLPPKTTLEMTSLLYKIGRNPRAVAPQELSGKTEDKLTEKDFKPTMYDVLLALRASRHIGRNMLAGDQGRDNKNQVLEKLDKHQIEVDAGVEDHFTTDNGEVEGENRNDNEISKEGNSSDSDEVKSLSSSTSSVVQLKEGAEDKVESIFITEELALDPSKPVFGEIEGNEIKQDLLAGRIDSLYDSNLVKEQTELKRLEAMFSSSTPSSVGSCDKHVFEAQQQHNKDKQNVNIHSVQDKHVPDEKLNDLNYNISGLDDEGNDSSSLSILVSTTLPTVSSNSTLISSADELDFGHLKYFE